MNLYIQLIEKIENAATDAQLDIIVSGMLKEFLPKFELFAKRKLGGHYQDWEIVVSEAIMAVVNIIREKKFDKTRAERLPSYILKVIQNKSYDYQKLLKNPGPTLSIEENVGNTLRVVMGELKIEKSQRLKRLKQCLGQLKPRHRQVIELFFWQTLKPAEIKKQLNLKSDQEVYNLKKYALTQMKTCLGGKHFFSLYCFI